MRKITGLILILILLCVSVPVQTRAQENLFTPEEQEYIASLPVLRIACQIDADPISYVDSGTGKLAGVNMDVLEMISDTTGIKFEYVELPLGEVTYDMLCELSIDIVSGVENNEINNSMKSIYMTTPYLHMKKVVVGKQGVAYSRDAELTLTVCSGSQTLSQVISERYPYFNIVKYTDNFSCMEAIVEGDADVMIQNQYVVQRLIAKPQFSELSVIPSEEIDDNLCMSVMVYKNGYDSPDPVLSDPRLISVLNKAIEQLKTDEVSASMIRHTTDRPYIITVSDILYSYREVVVIIGAGVILFLCAWLYIFFMRKQNYALLLQSENRIRSITNNIDGGVVVLRVGESVDIVFANDGFFNLIGCPDEKRSEIIEKDFMELVYPDDAEQFRRLFGQKKFSLRIRIRHESGDFVPTRLGGAVSLPSGAKSEIDCVITDISQEIEMLNRLDAEQRKHNLVFEKSNEIVYELDLENERIHTSSSFMAMFGWDPEKEKLDIDQMAQTWRIYEQDRELFNEMIWTAFDNNRDASCQVRMMTADGSWHWFEISQFVMNDSAGRLYAVLGKINDIDEQVKERRLLERRSQTDTMTGLYNKEAFMKVASEYLEKTQDKAAAVLFIDLDGFKRVNDVLGHMTGDNAIIDTAKRLQIIYSSYDILTRFGGDEFCVLVKEIPWNTLLEKVDWTLGRLKQTFYSNSGTIDVTASIGIARTSDCGFDIAKLVSCADEAMYMAKQRGKNGFTVYGEDNV